jgi:hypothetical protein
MNPVAALSGLRLAVGVGAWAAPNLAGRLFGLYPANNPQAAFLGRLFGARDVALAAGTQSSDLGGRRLWLQAGLACDVADVGAAYLAGRNGTVPKAAALMSGLTAAGAVALGVAALQSTPGGGAGLADAAAGAR